MKKILFPTDFSDCARNALSYAIALAAAYHSKLVLYHAYPIPLPPAELPGYYDEAGAEAIRKEASRKLQSWREVVEKSGLDIDCDIRLEPGPVDGNLLRYAEEAGIDEIIMGTEGARGLKKIFLGSHAARIVADARCPVMIVPEYQEFKGIHKMVYATNYYDENQDTLEGLMDLVLRFNAELTIVHYVDPKEDFTDEIFTWYQDVVKEKYPEVNMSFELLHGNSVGDALETYMKASGSDLLVMVNRKKGLWDKLFATSQTQKLTLHAETVVLVFHPDGKNVSKAETA